MKRQYYNGNCFKYFFKNPKFKTIVFIHGLGLNQDVWSWQVSLFKNYNVLIYDLLGHGDSKNPEGEISLNLFADQLLQIINHIKLEKFVPVPDPYLNNRASLTHKSIMPPSFTRSSSIL